MSEAPESRPLLLGHRGARLSPIFLSDGRLAPGENTLNAFEYAVESGCDGFEFDLHVTKDGRLFVCHDPEFRASKIAETRLSDLPRDPRFHPVLEEVLQRFATRAHLDIELKVLGAEAAVVEAVRDYPPQRGFFVSSFLPRVLLRMHELDPSIPLGYICQRAPELHLWRELPIAVVVPHYKLASRELIDEGHARGVRVFTWTVNRGSDMLRLAKWGIDGLISDNPHVLSRTFGVAPPQPVRHRWKRV